MRTYYDEGDQEAYETTRDLLARRFASWADERNREVGPPAVMFALDFRHTSVDGRLAYWTASLVREFLLIYMPRTVAATAEEAALAPETLRLFLRYLHETGLADPLGDPLADLEDAVAEAAPGFPAAMDDERNFAVGKYWLMTAARKGIDRADPDALNAFFAEVREGRHSVDDEVLAELVARQWEGDVERALPQLPVSLPADAELAEVAERTALVSRLRKLVEWVGDGRAVTGVGDLKLADARDLAALLDTGDVVERGARSSAELTNLALVVELAKRARIVRVAKGKLVRVARAAPLVKDALALWTAAFDALAEPGVLVRPGPAPGYAELFDDSIDIVLPDVLNTIYGMPEPTPVVRLAESVWLACTEAFDVDIEPSEEPLWRDGLAGEFRGLLGKLAEFGAVELTTGPSDPMYASDLVPENEEMPPDVQDRLRSALQAPSVELVTLTPLATRAVRARMQRQGRYAPLVGELATAPATMLGVVAQHYTGETAAAEVSGWLAAHGGPGKGLPLLLDAVRSAPFRTRAADLLGVLVEALPDGGELLHGLRDDPDLGPIAWQLLIDRGELALESLGEREGLLAMAEQFLVLLETAGPEQVAAVLDELPGDERANLAKAILGSGHPDRVGLGELAEVFEH